VDYLKSCGTPYVVAYSGGRPSSGSLRRPHPAKRSVSVPSAQSDELAPGVPAHRHKLVRSCKADRPGVRQCDGADWTAAADARDSKGGPVGYKARDITKLIKYNKDHSISREDYLPISCIRANGPMDRS
jgi:hypothetical protein